jgi:hypothetical protein
LFPPEEFALSVSLLDIQSGPSLCIDTACLAIAAVVEEAGDEAVEVVVPTIRINTAVADETVATLAIEVLWVETVTWETITAHGLVPTVEPSKI